MGWDMYVLSNKRRGRTFGKNLLAMVALQRALDSRSRRATGDRSADRPVGQWVGQGPILLFLGYRHSNT